MNLDARRGAGRAERRGGGGVIVASTIAMLEQKQCRATPSAMAKSDVKIGGTRADDSGLPRRRDGPPRGALVCDADVPFYSPPSPGKGATGGRESTLDSVAGGVVQTTVAQKNSGEPHFRSHRRTPSVYSVNLFRSACDDGASRFESTVSPSDLRASNKINSRKQLVDLVFADMASSSLRPLLTQQSSDEGATTTTTTTTSSAVAPVNDGDSVSASFNVILRKSPTRETEDMKCDGATEAPNRVSGASNRDSGSTNSLEIGSTSSGSTRSLPRSIDDNRDDNLNVRSSARESSDNQNTYPKIHQNASSIKSIDDDAATNKDERFSQSLKKPIEIKTNPSLGYSARSRTDQSNGSNAAKAPTPSAVASLSSLNDCSFKIPEAFQNIAAAASDGPDNYDRTTGGHGRTLAQFYDIPMDSSVDSKYSESGNERRSTTDHGDGSSSNWLTSDNEDSSVTTTDSCSSDEEDESSSSGQEFILESENGHHGGGLEPITEEDRPVTASSANTGEEAGSSADNADSSTDAESGTLKVCPPLANEVGGSTSWSTNSNARPATTSTSDMSNTPVEKNTTKSNKSSYRPQIDNSTRCDDDFQWFGNNSRPDHSSSPANSYTKETKQTLVHTCSSPVRLDHHQQQQQQLQQQHIRQSPIHHQPVTAKPPTSRPPLRARSESSPRRQTPEKQTGSLDRRRIHHGNRQERDQKSRSTQDHRSPDDHREIYFPPPPPRSELVLSPQSTQTPSCSCYEAASCSRRPDDLCQEDLARYEKPWSDESAALVHKRCELPFQSDPKFVAQGESPFHRHHERSDPKRYGSSTVLVDYDAHDGHRHYRPRHDVLVDHRVVSGSHPDLYGIGSDRGHGVYGCRNTMRERSVDSCSGCCAYHTLPRMPCCHYGSEPRNYSSWTPYNKNPDQDGKVQRLESEKESLQMQVSVLSEQIEAQTDKISELEKTLLEKKQLLGNTEELLQREMLSRSSLETQKLELMSAMSELKLQQAALERENIELRTSHYNNNPLGNHIQQSSARKPLLSRTSPVPQHTSTPVHASQLTGNTMSPSSSCLVSNSSLGGPSPIRTDGMQTHHEISQPRTPPASFRRTVDIRYGSLPRQAFPTNGRVDSNANQQQQSATLGPKKGVVFADADKTIEDNIDGMSYSPQQSPLLQINKNKGIKKIFSKMKRSGSGNLEDLPSEGQFRRGGVRATANARLGWSEAQDVIRPPKPFDEWDTDIVVEWLEYLGLDIYATEAKRWLKNGEQLRLAPVHDLEKELGIKNALHRKKIQLAILELTDENSSDPLLALAGKLDTAWVLRWLDDTGLPQHKDAFSLGLVDGRMLHRLTIDDLASLHVTSLLHANSLRRGIQVLRENSFDPDCLIRRSTPGESDRPEPEKVRLWTAHRVMEWLRAVDLAEYAPNLRGAGVHGSLMVYEPKFTAELLATLLNISPSKTLLRRHLSTHFKELLGREVIQVKREAEATLGYVPLTPATKLKVAKKSQFSLKRKKSKGEPDYGDLVCPLGGSSSGAVNTIVQSGELTSANIGSTSHGDASGTMKTTDGRAVAVCHLVDDPALTDEVFHSVGSGTSPVPTRIKDSMLV